MSELVRTPQVVVDDAEIFAAHEGGKLSIDLKAPLDTQRALSIAYTPGVAQVSRAIAADVTLAKKYTWANRLVAVVSDGSAVLGLGDIGAAASLPVMEGKSALFKTFGGLDSIPIVLDTKDPDEVVETLIRLRPTFGAVNLEDISAPRCFEIERRVIEALDCPVMHDDQHGTAIITAAALLNCCQLQERETADLKVVCIGAGASAIACMDLWIELGVKRENIIMTDSRGVIRDGRAGVNQYKAPFARPVDDLRHTLADAMKDADVMIGLSSGGTVPVEMVESMGPRPVIFALANPDPEIPYDDAVAARPDAIVATGRSDFPNQVNNVPSSSAARSTSRPPPSTTR